LYSKKTTCLSSQASPDRAALYSLSDGIIILHWIEEKTGKRFRSIQLECSSKEALTAALQKGPHRVRLATQDNNDIILEIKRLVKTLQTGIKPQHGISKAGRKQQSRKRVQTFYCNAGEYIETNASVLQEGKYNSGGLSPLVKRNLHFTPLKEKLTWDNKWSDKTFSRIDWGGVSSSNILPPPNIESIHHQIVIRTLEYQSSK